jgi:hypothetical protein
MTPLFNAAVKPREAAAGRPDVPAGVREPIDSQIARIEAWASSSE